jgi:hypothetical protein
MSPKCCDKPCIPACNMWEITHFPASTPIYLLSMLFSLLANLPGIIFLDLFNRQLIIFYLSMDLQPL